MAAPHVPPAAMAADSSSSGPTSRGTATPTEAEAARLEAAVDEAIKACDGDLRGTIRALILANEFLEQELCAMFAAVSRGYARGRFGRVHLSPAHPMCINTHEK